MSTPRFDRVLVTRLRFLGDIVLSTPLLAHLRAALPDAAIEYLGCAPHVDVLRHHPAVDELHVLSANPGWGEMFAMATRLRRRRFDAAIDLFSNPRSALLVRATGAPLRVGGDRGARARLFTHRRGRPAGDRSAVRHHLDKSVALLGAAPHPGPTRLYVRDAERDAVASRFGLTRPPMVVHPGSTWPEKAWPLDRFEVATRRLVARGDGPVLVLTPPGDEETAVRVAAASGAQALPALSVREVLAVLAHARLYLGNDGGILHAAVALERPTVGLFGPTEPDVWFPYEERGPYRVVRRCDEQAPPGASRLGDITVDEVMATIEDVLTRQAAS